MCMYLCHALKQSTTPSQGCKKSLLKAGKSESPSTNEWIRDVPDTPERQAPKCATDTLQKKQNKKCHSIVSVTFSEKL